MLHNLERYVSTRFRIRQSVMMIGQIVSTSGRYCLELIIRQAATEMTAGFCQGVIKLVIRIVHLIDTKDLFQAAFVEWTVMCHKWQTFYFGRNLFPDIREYRRVFRVLL